MGSDASGSSESCTTNIYHSPRTMESMELASLDTSVLDLVYLHFFFALLSDMGASSRAPLAEDFRCWCTVGIRIWHAPEYQNGTVKLDSLGYSSWLIIEDQVSESLALNGCDAPAR